jgi:hypothetical protein
MEFKAYYGDLRIQASLEMSPREFGKRKQLHGEERFMQAIRHGVHTL